MLAKKDAEKLLIDILDQISIVTNLTYGLSILYQLSISDKLLVNNAISKIRNNLNIVATNIDVGNQEMIALFDNMDIAYEDYIAYLMNFINCTKELMRLKVAS